MDGYFEDTVRHLVERIIGLQKKTSEKWRSYCSRDGLKLFNQKSTKVIHLNTDEKLLILSYLEFLNNESVTDMFEEIGDRYVVVSRVKNRNSIEEKIEDYCRYRAERGEVPVNKCLNDLFGVRIILDCGSIDVSDIEGIIAPFGSSVMLEVKNDLRPNNLKYLAYHIYFKESNSDFKWELQIWKKEDERSNQESHKTHRYKYRMWESKLGKEES